MAQSTRKNIVDIHPLSPLQQGMLVHTLTDPQAYFEQVAVEVTGNVDIAVWQRAWQAVVDRHCALRSSFLWQRKKAPLQIVHRSVDMPFTYLDWSAQSSDEREVAYTAYCADDRARGFRLEHPPLLRVTMIRLGNDQYRLLLSFHHLLCDGWSLSIIVRDFLDAYRATLLQAPWNPMPARPFRDYIAWLQQADQHEALDYWQSELSGMIPTALPTGFPDGKAAEPYAEAEYALPPELSARLTQLARDWRITPSTLLQGLWALLLYRHAGGDEITFGSTVSGRTIQLPGVAEMVGVFINTLPVRARIPAGMTAEAFFTTLHERMVHMQDYDYVALTEMQRASGLSHETPLFESIVVMENHPLSSVSTEAGVLPFRLSGHGGYECTGYPLTLSIVPENDQYRLVCAYQTARFDTATISRLLRQYAALAVEILDHPQRAVDEICGMPSEEMALLSSWNCPVSTEREFVPVHRLFDRCAEAHPDETAVISGPRSFTYRELRTLADRVVGVLGRHGIAPEARVGVLMEKGVELPALLLGILKSGATFVLIDPASPVERTRTIISEAGLSLLISDRSLPETAVSVISLDEILQDCTRGPVVPLQRPIHPAQLAYVVFTSGSTGVPKGVGISHRAFSVTATAWRAAYDLRPGLRHLQMANQAFDVFCGDFVRALCTGGILVFCPRETLLSPPDLYAMMREQHVNCAEFVPAVLRGLMSYVRETGSPLDGLQLIAVGSDLWRVAEHRALRALLPPSTRVIDSYGVAEATIDSCFYEGDPQAFAPDAGTPIGHRLPHVRLYVLDQTLQPVPLGVTGELYIGGLALARGYIGQPGLTAERFLPDLFSDIPGARMYRTGDAARFRPDGTLEFVGRCDFQVKIRGIRVETGEIEACLRTLPDIRDAVVDARIAPTGEKRLVAYCIADRQPDPRELRRALREKLSEAMIPSAIHFLPEFPLNANGKVDRAVLPDPVWDSLAATYLAPTTPEEEIVAGIWQEILGIERVGITDNFFDLGGHSLLATQVVARINAAFGCEMPLRLLFETSTLAELAAAITGTQHSAEPMLPGAPMEFPPLSLSQERMWFMQRLAPSSAALHQPDLVRVRGELDIEALQRTLDTVVLRHAILRTTFPLHEGVPYQRVAEKGNWPIISHDLRHMPYTEREEAAAQLVQAEAARSFDLQDGPLLRGMLVRLDEQESLLLLVTHHILSDGWSSSVMLREVIALYTAELAGRAAELPTLPIQYIDYACWQREHIADIRDEHLPFWTELLQDAPPLELPTDFPRTADHAGQAGWLTAVLDADTVRALRRLAGEESATLFMVLLSAFTTLLAQFSQQDDMVVGTPVANRRHRETEELIGLFVNTLAMRCDLSGEPTFRELLGRVRRMAIQAYTHQDLPFDMVVDAVHPERDLTRMPLCQVLFVLQNTPTESLSLPGVTMQPEALPVPATQFDLTLAVDEVDDTLRVNLVYHAGLFRKRTAQRLLSHYTGILRQALANPDIALSAIELLDEEERRTLAGWQGEKRTVSGDMLIHHMAQRHALASPEQLAICDGTYRLTYRELDDRSRRLATELRRFGIRQDMVVALWMPRSPELLVSTLAVLHAGAAFLPLDPHLPTERLIHILGECGTPLVLTTPTMPRERIPAGHQVLVIDASMLEDLPAEGCSASVHTESTAYIIYTSGSTGVPKGVAVSHRAANNMAAELCQRYGITANDRILQAVSPSFDVACSDLFMAWHAGATLVLAPMLGETSGIDLAELIETQQVTFAQLPPSVLSTLPARQLPSLRAISVGGESSPAALVRRWTTSQRAIFNSYGPTETAVCVTTWRCLPDDDREVPPIGNPIGNVEAYVLDAYLRPCPSGVLGELYLGGASLARGYVNRPDLTATAFLPNPFSNEPGARLYRTGDIVRWNDDGTLYFVGRRDGQVKLHGHRIELQEIDAVLRRIDGVTDALTMMREDRPGTRRLVAYVIMASSIDESAMVEELRRVLPDYMIPSAFITLPAFPLTSNGKVKRAALPAPVEDAEETTLPRTQTERLLCDIWREVLPIDDFGIHDDFFALGGHSMLAVRVIARVNQACEIELPLRAIFDHPTIAKLAGQVEDMRKTSPARHGIHSGMADAPTLSFAQERLWFIDQLLPESASYAMPALLGLTGTLDVSALRNALTQLAARHETLRLTITEAHGAPVPHIAENVEIALPVITIPSGSPEAQRAEVMRLAQQEVDRNFLLADGPLLRCCLYRLSDTEHVLLLVLHHIIGDGWSMDILGREMALLYAAHVTGTSCELPPLPINYSDYAYWQRNLLADRLEQHLDYWKTQLADAPELVLHTDRPRPPVRGGRGAMERITCSAALLAKLEACARQQHVTLFMLLLAGWAALLAQYSGQEDFVIGSPVSGREEDETAGLIGLFVNTLPLRLDLSASPTFRELLSRVRTTVLDGFAHQQVPFERIVEALCPDRNLAQNPIFQVMFTLQEGLTGNLSLPQLAVTPWELPTTTTKFDLTVAFATGDNGLTGIIEYDTDIFRAETIARMLSHFVQLLEHAAATPETPCAALSLMDAAQEQRLIRDYADTATPYPDESTIVDLFDDIVADHPQQIAICCGDEAMSYAELQRRANQLANYLQNLGIQPDELVAVAIPRSAQAVIAILGILKAGGAYLPLDTSFPSDRLHFMLQDAGVRTIITADALPQELVANCRVVSLHRDAVSIAQMGKLSPVVRISPQRLAYANYTSGSTGMPKGVLIPHQAVVRLVRGTNYLSFVPGQVIAQQATISFDAATFEIWGPLLNGGTIRVIPDGALLAALSDPKAASPLEGVDAIFMTTALFNQIAEHRPEFFANIGCVLFGGEAASVRHVRLAQQRLPLVQLINVYGPTETTTFATWHPVKQLEADTVTIPIGRALANTTLYVLNQELCPVPPGVTGELYIGGPGVARGYLRRPQLTAERFVPNPFAQCPGERLYRTGDLVRMRADGAIEYVARADQQVKVRGFRIELGEVEHALQAVPGVRMAAVTTVDDAIGAKQLVAYLVTTAGVTEHAVAEALRSRLPEYMIPAMFVQLDELPLNAHGKVDFRRLPSADLRARPSDDAPLTTPEERLVAEVWSETLGVSVLCGTDHFFALGGHSLLATRAIARLRERTGRSIPLRLLFAAPTVREFASHLALISEAEAVIPAIAHDGPLPLSSEQERLWFLEQFTPGTVLYNVPLASRLHGQIVVPALHAALRDVVARHDVLRTTFSAQQQAPQAIVHAQMAIPLQLTELSELPAEEREAAMQRELAADAYQPFDLTTGPLVRARLIRLTEDEAVFVLVLHHIVCDGWSIGLVNQELMERYQAHLAGNPAPLAPSRIQYADYAAWQRSPAFRQQQETSLRYWTAQLANLPTLELPTDRPRPAMAGTHGDEVDFTLPASLSAQVDHLAQELEATQYMVLLAAFSLLLARYSGQQDIVIGTPVANREAPGTQELIGFFANTLALRVTLEDASTFRALVARVKAMTSDAYEHQHAPFEQVVHAVQPERDTSRTPLFQVMLVLQNLVPPSAPPDDTLEIEPVRVRSNVAKFDLTVTLDPVAGEMAGIAEYATDLFNRATIERLMCHFRHLLAACVDNPDAELATLSLLNVEERRQMLALGQPNQHVSTDDRLLHDLVVAAARRQPEAIALTGDHEQLSYRQLDGRANTLAWELQRRGVGPDVLVGVCLERSVDLIISMLAILKAGGAYLPIDPHAPVERTRYILSQSGTPLILTHAKQHAALPDGLTATVIDLATLPETLTTDAPPCQTLPDHLAYVIYTSGSTGQPKGNGITHGNAVRLFTATEHWFNFTPADVWSFFHSCAFDFSIWEIWGALCTGGRLVIVPYLISRAPDAFYDLLAREGVTMLSQTPSAFRTLLQEEETRAAHSDALPQLALRQVVFGGEALDPGALRSWYRRHPEHAPQLVNMYGITETTVHVTYHPLTQAEAEAGSGSLIGVPIPDLTVYVLDESLEPVPLSVRGEIYVGGAGLARGYLGRPDLTAERFIPDTFGTVPGARLYRSGDCGRYRADGTLEYLGRNDDQVKIRGFRIELGEVEAALRRAPGVTEAVVLARTDPHTPQRLVGYVVGSADWTEIRHFMATQLPDYMIPAAFVSLPSIPLTGNGKVDRRALPAPSATREVAEGYIAPRSSEEAELAAIWATVLGLDRVGVEDNFFALGGDSILSIQVVSRAREAGMMLTARDLFRAPTVAALARCVTRDAGLVIADDIAPGVAVPLTPIQRWFFATQADDRHHFNQAVMVRVVSSVSVADIGMALNAVITIHPALRLRTDGEQQWYDEQVEWPLEELPIPNSPEDYAAACTRMQCSLDITHGPLVRAGYFPAKGDTEARLFLVIHHLAVDGVSWRILLGDLQLALQQLSRGATPSLPPVTTSYARWAQRCAEDAESAETMREASDWQARCRALTLPVDRETAPVHGPIPCTFTAEETLRLVRDVHQAYQTRINDLLLAALATAVHQWNGDEAISVMLESHGREEQASIDLSRTVGWFTALHPVLLSCPSGCASDVLIKQTKECLRAIPRNGIGYGLLRYLGTGTEAEALRACPKPGLCFNYLGQFDTMTSGDGLLVPCDDPTGEAVSPHRKSPFIIEINGSIQQGKLALYFSFDAKCIAGSAVARLATLYHDALLKLVEHCLHAEAGGHTPSDFALAGNLSQAGLDKLLSKFKR